MFVCIRKGEIYICVWLYMYMCVCIFSLFFTRLFPKPWWCPAFQNVLSISFHYGHVFSAGPLAQGCADEGKSMVL